MNSLFEGIEETIPVNTPPEQETAPKPEQKRKNKKKKSTEKIPEFFDAKFMSAKEKEKAYKSFVRVIKNRDMTKMTKALYEHLHLHCGFIAHYNKNGFMETYSGVEGFREFIEHFDLNSKEFNWLSRCWLNDSDYKDINQPMVDLVTAHAPQIYAELDAQEQQNDLALARALAEKYGYKIG